MLFSQLNLKKVILSVSVLLFTSLLVIGSVFAYSNTASIICEHGDSMVTSSPTTYGTQAKYSVKNNYSDSDAPAQVSCMAGWKGAYPYTVEETIGAPKGTSKTNAATVTQSKTSRFKVRIHSSYFKTHAKATVTVVK